MPRQGLRYILFVDSASKRQMHRQSLRYMLFVDNLREGEGH